MSERVVGWRTRRADIETRTGVCVDTLSALQHGMAGTLVVPGDPDYDIARQLAGPTFQGYPIAVAKCVCAGDVRLCLAAAQQARWPFTCRSGGHSTAGYSVDDGLVIDLTGLSYALVDAETRRVRVGAGTTFDVLTAALDSYGLHLVGGGCGDVCIGGYLQGGGYGFSSLRFGMHCDVVQALRVMLADGSEVVASTTENPDLFWAMRGGTGNNFGVLLEAEYIATPIGTLSGFVVSWPVEHAAAALVTLQREFTGPTVPKALLGYMGMASFQHGHAVLTIAGMVDGTPEDTRLMLAPLLALPGATLVSISTGSYRDLDTSLVLALCPQPLPIPHFSEEKQTGYVARGLSAPEWQAVLDHLCASPSTGSIVLLEPYGGSISAVAPDAMAFRHRDVSMDLVFEAIWYDDAGRAAALAWLDRARALTRDMVTGHVYQNYPRRGLDDYRWRYWGENFDTLLWVKQKFDPADAFRFEQSVSPDPAGPPGGPVRFHEPRITYRYRPPARGATDSGPR